MFSYMVNADPLFGNDVTNKVIAGLWILSVVGNWSNFLTLFYIGNLMG
jgi:hypothetical protein